MNTTTIGYDNGAVVGQACRGRSVLGRLKLYSRIYLCTFCWILLITGCGGGGGDGSAAAPPPATPDFKISITPGTVTVVPGSSAFVHLTASPMNGFTGTVTVNVTGIPPGTSISPPVPFTMLPSGQQDLQLSVPSNAANGSFNLTVSASSGTLVHSASLTFQVQSQQQGFASFSVVLNNSELSFAQGGSANTTVGLSITSSTGSTNFSVEFSVAGLPNGVQANFNTNPLALGQPATLLTFTASPTASTANYLTVTVVGSRTADGLQETAPLVLNVTPLPGSLPAMRTDFVRMDGTPTAAVYDSAHNLVYASNPQWNRVDVISPATAQIVNSIPAPNATGMDMSLDGKHLLVGSNVQQIVTIDTRSLQVVKRTNVPPIVQGGAQYAIPALLANTSNGTVLVGMTLNSNPPAYYLEQWNPANDTFIPRSAPGVTAWINRMARIGDGSKVLVVDYGTGVNMAVYDAASDSFSTGGQSPVGQVLGVAGNPAAHQFAIVGTSGFAFVDDKLNVLATPQLGGLFWGMTYSSDGSRLSAMLTLSPSCGVAYPVILTFDTRSFALLGTAPAFQIPSRDPCFLYQQAAPLAANNTGIVYSAFTRGTSGSDGLLFEDAANFQNLLNLPKGPPFPSFGFIDEAPLNTPLATGLGQVPYDVLPDVWFGNIRGTNVQLNGPLVSVTAPPSATPGLVNVKSILPDGWFALALQAFSYGSRMLFLGGNAGSQQGGAALALIGYGLIGNNGSPAVTIGGQAAKVVAAGKYVDFNDSGFNITYPFADIDEVIVTVPPGSGVADVIVTSEAGTATLSKAFNYLPVSDYSSADTLTYVLYDPQRHWVYLSAGDHIDVFSADSGQFLAPIIPPSTSGSRLIRGLALTPDNSKLLAANFADLSVAIINPDNLSSSAIVHIPVTEANSPGVADVVATGTGTVFVDGVSGTFSGCGGQLFELDLATLAVTLRSDLPFPGLQLGGNSFSRSAIGNTVLLAGGGCGTFLWNAANGTFSASLPIVSDSSSASGDGYWFASDYTRLDPQAIQHIQAQVPEFFSVLLTRADLPGEKMNASGSLLYTPVPQGFGTVESNGIDITETGHGSWLGHILLTEQIAPVQSAMDFDEARNRLFLITNKGLTIVQLGPPPLSVGYLSPAAGPASGGTTVLIRGSGFQSGAVASFAGVTAATAFIDSSTLQVATPAGTAGGVRVTIQNPDGNSYSLDAGFTYE